TIKSATFHIPSDTGWYGVRCRKSGLDIQPIQEMLAQTNCPLETLTINDSCLQLSELADLCNKISKETILKRINIMHVVIRDETERTCLRNLEEDLSVRNIVIQAVENFNPTFGTSYH
ncbi:MAG TPA: hypothetical protein VIH61_08070, partial [Waddliaceae bacterium]